MAVVVRSVRRVTNDRRHNAFTGVCWFRGNLYLAYRQGDAHVGPVGRLVVLRSRDDGLSWDHVAVARGDGDTRDAHLYTNGSRLYAVGFTAGPANAAPGTAKGAFASGCISTEDGERWSPWTPYQGTGTTVLWRPQYHGDRHYCAGYTVPDRTVLWFESRDGIRWRKVSALYSGTDLPSECWLEIRGDGRATMLMRCEAGNHHPRLWTSRHPFAAWRQKRLTTLAATGPCCWTVGRTVYLGVRCHSLRGMSERGRKVAACDLATSQATIFKLVGGVPQLQWVLPAGPGFDNAYMAAARHPLNHRRFALSFYSDAVAGADATVSQWTHPDIYLADVLCDPPPGVTDEFLVSRRVAFLEAPDPAKAAFGFQPYQGRPDGDFLDLKRVVARQPGYVYALRDINLRRQGPLRLHLGYDGPVVVWWNGNEVFRGTATTPAIKDLTSLELPGDKGRNRLAVALDSDGGKADALFVRWETAWPG